MKSRLKVAIAGVATAVVTLATAGTAFAVTPGFEPDIQTNGACQPTATTFCTLRLYDANGIPKTSGLTTDAPFAAWLQADQLDARVGDTKAFIAFANPTTGATNGSGFVQGGAQNVPSAYPNAAAPAPLNNNTANPAGSGLPLVQYPTAASQSIANYLSTHALTSTSDPGVLQIRMFTSSPNAAGTNYYSADIKITGSSWTLVYPNPTATAAQVSFQETSPQVTGTPIHITATVTPVNAPGNVQFFSNGSPIGSAPTSAPTTPPGNPNVAGITATLPTGSNNVTATFTPADPIAYNGSQAPASVFQINQPAAQPTTTGLAVNTGAGQANSPVTFTATVAPAAAVGTVQFTEVPTGTVVGNAPSGSGTFIVVNSSLAQGPHSVQAVFTPSNNFTSSTSPVVNFVLGAAACPTCTDVQNITVSVPAGTLSISTPYHATNPLNLGSLVLNSTATQYSVTATFGGTGTNGITISDTRAGQPLAWTASVLASSLSQGGATISAENVGLTNLAVRPGQSVSAAAGNLTTFNNPAANPAVAPGDPGSQGLGGSTPHEAIHAVNGGGNVTYDGVLTITAPTTTPSGTYTGTITFTIG